MSVEITGVPLEKRSARRVTTPSGTKALLNGKGINSNHAKVKDISLVGMLISSHHMTEEYPINSSIDDICVSIPPEEAVSGAKTILFLGSGKIVRSFTDETSNTLSYGVEFMYNSLYIKERLMAAIETISPDSNN